MWQRALFAQALPLAAALNGVQVIHASGVVIDGHGFAFVGHSGAGKTSLALQLVDQGAKLLADDVVGLSMIDGRAARSPGCPLLERRPGAGRFGRVRPAGAPRQGGRSQRQGAHPGWSDGGGRRAARRPLLHRSPRVDSRAQVRAPRAAGPLSASRFNLRALHHVAGPDATRLEALSQIAERIPTFRLFVPLGLGASEVAPLVAAHARETVASEAAI